MNERDAWMLQQVDQFMKQEEDYYRSRSKEADDWAENRARGIRGVACFFYGLSDGEYGRPSEQ